MEGDQEFPSGHQGPEDNTSFVSPKEQQQDELIQKTLQVGKSSIYTWSGFGTSGRHGWQRVAEESDPDQKNSLSGDQFEAISLAFDLGRYDGGKSKEFPDKKNREELEKRGVFEVVAIAPLLTDVEETRIVQVPYKSWFRTKQREVKEQYLAGQEPQTMTKINGGPDVPAAGIYYSASASPHGRKLGMVDAIGRPGVSFDAKFLVPVDLVGQISTRIREDPKFIRRLTEAFVRAKYPRKYIESTWEKFGKIPYEKWDAAEGGSRLYFVDLIKEPEARRQPLDDSMLARTIPITAKQ